MFRMFESKGRIGISRSVLVVCVGAALVLSACARKVTSQQLEPTRTLPPRSTAVAAAKSEATHTPVVKPATGAVLTRENVSALAEKFVRREVQLQSIYTIAADRVGAYNARTFETFDLDTLASLKQTAVKIDDAAGVFWYALSADARRGVTMSPDGHVDVYDLVRGEVVERFEVGVLNRMLPADVALDVKGEMAAIVANGKLTRSAVASGTAMEPVLTISPTVSFIFFARDASHVALIDAASGAIGVMNTNDGDVVELARPVEKLLYLTFSPDAQRLSTSTASEVQIWDARTGEEIGGMANLDEAVNVALPPRGDIVALYGRGGGALLYNIDKREAGDEIKLAGGGQIYDLKFSADGSALYALGGGLLERFDVQTARSTATLRRFAMTQAQWTPQNEMLVWSDRYQHGELALLNGEDGTTLRSMQHDAPLKRVIVARSGRLAAVGTADEALTIWKIDDGSIVRRIAAEENSPRRLLLCMSADEKSVVYFEAGEIAVQPLAGGQVHRFQPPFAKLLDVAYCDNQSEYVAFQDAKNIEVMSLDGRTVSTIDIGETLTHSVQLAISADGRWAGAITDRALLVWDARTGERALRRELKNTETSASYLFDPRAGRLVLRDGDDHFFVDIATGREVKMDVPQSHVVQLYFPKDERLLLTTSRILDMQRPMVGGELNFVRGAITIWDVESGRVLRTIDLDAPVYSAALSADGAKLAMFGYDGAMTMWSVK